MARWAGTKKQKTYLILSGVFILAWVVYFLPKTAHENSIPAVNFSTETAACEAHGGLQNAYISNVNSDAVGCPDGTAEEWSAGKQYGTASCAGRGEASAAYVGKNGVQCADGTLVAWTQVT